jgi:ADP-heptose:LPS heptosyltransferase
MRILASNPDGIGDLVLRQPMYAALADAGHDLLLVVRPLTAPLVTPVAPKAGAVVLESDPYYLDFSPDAADVQQILAAARDFAPDVFCIAPYQRTVFDEFLAKSLEGCLTVGMAGMLYRGYIKAGLDYKSQIQLHRQVTVPADAHELRKNERLCSALLGKSVKLPDPAIEPEPHQIDVASARLARLGLHPGGYWIGCVGHDQYTGVRNWSTGNWAQVLSHAANQYGRRFLLIGTPDENEATEEIRRLMGSAAEFTENLCGTPEALDTILGLIHLSAGYIGRDTGPMHLAAAMGKPVLAVFGGGTWPRFTPAAKTGAVLTMLLPCAGCDWICHLPESHCVKRVPVEAVIEALHAIEAGKMSGVRIQQLRPSEALWARVIREGGKNFRELQRRLGATQRQHDAHIEDQKRLLAELQAELDSLRPQAAGQRQESSRLAGELARIEADHEAQLRRLDSLTAERDSQSMEIGALRAQEAGLRKETETLRAYTEGQKPLLAERQAELDSLRPQAAGQRQESSRLAGELARIQADHEELVRQFDALTAERDFLSSQHQIEQNRSRLLKLDADRIEELHQVERRKLLDLISDLKHEAEASVADVFSLQQNLRDLEAKPAAQSTALETSEAERMAQLTISERQDLRLREAAEGLEHQAAQTRESVCLADDLAQEIESLAAEQASLRGQLREAEAQVAAQQQQLGAMEEIVGFRAVRTALARIAAARGKRLSETLRLLGFAWNTLRSRRGPQR